MANEVKIKVTADDKASGKINKLTGSLKKGLMGGAVAGGVAIAGLGIASIKMAADFDKAFGEVTTLFDAPKGQVADMRKAVKALSSEMGIGAVEATEALYSAISAGVDPQNAVEFLKSNAKFAIAGVTDLNTAVDLSTTVMNAWNLESGELEKVQDTLFAGVQAGKTTVDELAASMGQVAPIAAAAGITVDEVTAALATLTAQGANTSEAATRVKSAFAELSKEGSIADKSFQKLTGESFVNFVKGGGDVKSAMEIMEQGAKESGLGINNMFGSVEAGLGVLALTGDSAELFATNLDKVAESGGNVEGAFEKMNATFDRQFAILKTQLSNVMLQIGEVILPILINALEKLNPWLQDKIPQAIAAMESAWADAQPEVEEFEAFINDDLMPTLEVLGGWLESSWPTVVFVFNAAIDDLLMKLEVVMLAIKAINAVLEFDWAGAWDTAAGAVEAAAGRIGSAIDSIPGVPDVGGGIGDLFEAGTGVAKDIIGLGLGRLRRHSGGVVPGPIGAEVPVTLLGGERVTSLSGAGGGGTNIEIHVHADSEASEEQMKRLSRFVRDEIDQLTRTNSYGGTFAPSGAFIP